MCFRVLFVNEELLVILMREARRPASYHTEGNFANCNPGLSPAELHEQTGFGIAIRRPGSPGHRVNGQHVSHLEGVTSVTSAGRGHVLRPEGARAKFKF